MGMELKFSTAFHP
jgi:hypothetical protein